MDCVLYIYSQRHKYNYHYLPSWLFCLEEGIFYRLNITVVKEDAEM